MGLFLLVGCIICSSLLLNIFRFYQVFKVNTLAAIVVNYFTAASFSFILFGQLPSYNAFISTSWWWLALLLGVLFIVLFNLMAFCSNYLGIAATSIANKVTFVFPVLMGFWIYHDPFTWIKGLGIILSIIAVFLTGGKSKSEPIKNGIWWLIALFVGGGLLDALLSYGQKTLIPEPETSFFFGHVFLFAGITGLSILLLKVAKNKTKVKSKDLLWGVILGVPNFFSMYFFLRSLSHLPTSVAFPAANMGIIVVASLLSRLIFKEHISKLKAIALLLSIIAITLISI